MHESFMLLEEWTSGRHLLPDTTETVVSFTNATKFKTETDIFKAYKLALTDRWVKDKRKPTRTNSAPPTWKEKYEQLLLQTNRA